VRVKVRRERNNDSRIQTYELPADARTPSKNAFRSTPFCFAIITASPAATRCVAYGHCNIRARWMA
jgi:hypothetical protein